ncbi:MAG: molybdopterin-dependent oxidoreductase [Pirellulales bacterium]
MTHSQELPPGQQLVAPGKWPSMGERSPRADNSPWVVRVCGAVSRPATYTLDELRAIDRVEQTIDLHCVTRWSKLGVRFAGVPLASVVERAAPKAGAAFVSFVARSDREHSTSLALSDALALGALVALEAEGSPLPQDRGGPVRAVVPGRYFYKSLKWLERIELLTTDRLGYWEATAGYHNLADPWREERYIAPNLSKVEAQAILARRDLTGSELLGLDAPGCDLAGLNARGAQLRNADFRETRLRGACFDRANLTNAHLQRADLTDASLRDADLQGVDFAGADLRGACLLGASFVGATLGSTPADTVVVDARTQFSRSCLDELAPEQCLLLSDALARAGAVFH